MRTGSITLLHNWPFPNTQVVFEGARNRQVGFGIVIELPGPFRDFTVSQLLELLEPGNLRCEKEASEELRRRLQAKALELPLPPVVPITNQRMEGDVDCKDILTIMTVLSKSSSSVYLRDKEPKLASIAVGFQLVLIVPQEVAI